eukprot:m.527181 g.527181  ORF g.527181 m.527181 type:complete len:515 (+) comp57558_c0_seq1:762-2306(+)
MGNLLRTPVTEKDSIAGAGNGLRYACSAMQGYRVEMEDAHILQHDIPELPGCALFTVFDGHGGKTVSTMSETMQIPALLRTAAFLSGDKSEVTLGKMLHEGFYELDRELRTHPPLQNGEDESGSTATSVLVTPTHIIFANCGDSRSVLFTSSGVKFGTTDHKPNTDSERERINRAGGYVEAGRVNGNLAISRALGDYSFKMSSELPDSEQQVVVESDITIFERSAEDQFLLLACDGIWDVCTNESACEFVVNQLKAGYSPQETCERMLDHCLGLDSKDNMTAMVVLFDGAPQAVEGFVAPPLASRPQPASGAHTHMPPPAYYQPDDDDEEQPDDEGDQYGGQAFPSDLAQLLATLRGGGQAQAGFPFHVSDYEFGDDDDEDDDEDDEDEDEEHPYSSRFEELDDEEDTDETVSAAASSTHTVLQTVQVNDGDTVVTVEVDAVTTTVYDPRDPRDPEEEETAQPAEPVTPTVAVTVTAAEPVADESAEQPTAAAVAETAAETTETVAETTETAAE